MSKKVKSLKVRSRTYTATKPRRALNRVNARLRLVLKSASVFFAALTSSVVPSTGTFSSFTRASTATVEDFEGLNKDTLSGEVRLKGSRRVCNLVEEPDMTLFSQINASCSMAGSYTDPLGGTDAYLMTINDLTSPQVYDTFSVKAGNEYVISVWIKLDTAPVNRLVGLLDPAFATAYVQATKSWKRHSIPLKTSAGGTILLGFSDTSGVGVDIGDKIAFYGWQIEDVTGQADQNPSEFVSVGVESAPYHGANVDGVKYYETENNTSMTVLRDAATSTTDDLVIDTDKVVVALGDSNTEGNDEWIDLFQDVVTAAMVNRGVGGDFLSTDNNAASVEARWSTDVVAIDADEATIFAGANDIHNGITDAATALSVVANMETAIANIYADSLADGVALSFANCQPLGTTVWTQFKQDGIDAYNTALLAFCTLHNLTHFDIYTEMANVGDGKLATAYDSGDGLHYSQAGDQALADFIFTHTSYVTRIELPVVREAGTPIAETTLNGVLTEGASTNYFLNSGAPVTQAAMVTAGAVEHTITTTGTIVCTADGASVTVGIPYTWTTGATANIVISSGAGTVQVEALPFATSYIPTVASAVTRVLEDLVETAPTNIQQTTSEITVVGEFNTTVLPSLLNETTNWLWSIKEDANNKIGLYFNSAGSLVFFNRANSVTASSLTTGMTASTRYKYVCRLDVPSKTMSLFLNGVKVDEDAAVNAQVWTSSVVFSIGSEGSGATPAYCPNKNVEIYKEALSDVKCLELSTI